MRFEIRDCPSDSLVHKTRFTIHHRSFFFLTSRLQDAEPTRTSAEMLLLRHAVTSCQGWTHATVCLHQLRGNKSPRFCASTTTLVPTNTTDYCCRMETLPILRPHLMLNSLHPLQTRSNDRHLPSSPSHPTCFAKHVSRTSTWSPTCSQSTSLLTRTRNT